MNILVVGLNHKTADVGIREKLAFSGEKCLSAIGSLKNSHEIDEILLLSTCNRVEFYIVAKDIERAREKLFDFIAHFHHIERNVFESSLYIHENRNAMKHVFRVASSLDSMVLGEPQILGQIKKSFECALNQKTSGIILNRFMRKAISVAKKIRTETGIAENAVSISFAAVELAKKIFDDLSSTTFMLMGAGEMAELAARHMLKSGIKSVFITNRTYERAQELAQQLKGKAVPFDNFKNELTITDIAICSTGSSRYILTKPEMASIMKERKHRQMFIIDIAVPRNIDPEINDIDNVYLYDIDDLQNVVDSNLGVRQKEAQKADAIVEQEVESFVKWYKSLDVTPTVVELRKKAENIRRAELERAMKRLNGIGEKEFKTIDAMTQSIVNKLIHPPTVLLRSDEENKEEIAALVKRLYGLDNGQ